jgi:hypothetical protein
MPNREIAYEPFVSAEEAWFWCSRCYMARRAGTKPDKHRLTKNRPCDPEDIFGVLDKLYKMKHLSDAHLKVLGKFGVLQQLPDSNSGKELKLWRETMDKIYPILLRKNIILNKEEIYIYATIGF